MRSTELAAGAPRLAVRFADEDTRTTDKPMERDSAEGQSDAKRMTLYAGGMVSDGNPLYLWRDDREPDRMTGNGVGGVRRATRE